MFAGAVPAQAGAPAPMPPAEVKSIPASAPLAIPTRHVHANVAGVETHVVCQLFNDRLVVLISQVGKVGTLMQASLSNPSAPGLGEEHVLAMLSDAVAPGLDDGLDDDPDAHEDAPSDRAEVALEWTPPPLVSAANARHTVLTGTPPSGLGMLYNLICSQVLSLILYQANGYAPAPPTSVRAGQWVRPPTLANAGIVPPPVVIGIGLRPLPSASAASTEAAEVAEMDFFSSDNAAKEQERLCGILRLVSQARVW